MLSVIVPLPHFLLLQNYHDIHFKKTLFMSVDNMSISLNIVTKLTLNNYAIFTNVRHYTKTVKNNETAEKVIFFTW